MGALKRGHVTKEKRLIYKDKSLVTAAFLLFFEGVFANRDEYYRSMWSGEFRLAPVENIYLWGMLVVQPRGVPVHGDAFIRLTKRHPLWSHMLEEHQCTKGALGQFAVFGRKVLLVDFGWPGLSPVFQDLR